MLRLPREIADAVLRHAMEAHPIEACGVIAGPSCGPASRCIPLRNAAGSTDAFRFDPREQLAVWRDLDTRDEVPLALYHSHTSSPAFPSREDVAFAVDPSPHYLIVSTATPQDPELRSFRITSGRVTEETLVITTAP
ncbi:M67 family metallopeptidase [Acidovorax sp. NCPPB 2350]|nr:M67 family metallopeptidase [Acidovorax sp. NCPPB 2350]